MGIHQMFMKNLLITGGAGFIGSNFISHTLKKEKEIQIINLDALTYAGNLKNLDEILDPQRHIFVKGDICDRQLVEDLLVKYDVDTVVHFAAETHVDRSIVGPGQFIQTNIVGTYTLLEALRKVWLTDRKKKLDQIRFHHVSTDEVYGTLSPQDPAFSETTSYAPTSPYSASKASSDHLVRSYFHTYGLPVTISNCSNNYGPYQFPEKLIPVIILNALQGKPLPIYGDGKQIRDWLYVEDHCEAIRKILLLGKPGQTYNIGGNNQPTNIEIVKLICQSLDQRFPDSPHTPHHQLIKYITDRPGHDRRYAMNIEKIKAELDWHPIFSLEDGLENTITWYLENIEWIGLVTGNAEYQQWIAKNYTTR